MLELICAGLTRLYWAWLAKNGLGWVGPGWARLSVPSIGLAKVGQDGLGWLALFGRLDVAGLDSAWPTFFRQGLVGLVTTQLGCVG